MLSIVETVTLIIVAAFTALGSVVNGFIVAVNGIDWVKSRHLNSIDVILTCLAAARFCFQWGIMLENILFAVYPDSSNETEFSNILLFTWVFLEISSFWFACCLSVFYCTKIASFSHPLFTFLKLKIPGIVRWMLLGSVLASIVTSIPTAWEYYKENHSNSTTGLSPNDSNLINCTLVWDLCKEHQYNFTKRITPNAGGLNVVFNYNYLVPILFLGYSLPFFIFCVAALLLIGSLWSHTWRMKNSSMAFSNPSLEAHFTAIKVMTTFFLFSTFCFICRILDIIMDLSTKNPWTLLISFGIAAYPSLHSVILILSNSKLRKSWARILHHGRCPSGRETPKPSIRILNSDHCKIMNSS
ncbi:taste receptor type 2 member 40-like [Rhinatrema bivittatum]|uniref:taste receptor type 2 member 40-like n=1 Tax=Rhinatrema bivittatum TaxID=194408 RepID=UPI00112B9B7A|nr:taste receptor type 2 member 40-like [Rhinatrema bivittatum]